MRVCNVNGCERTYLCKGFCSTHYARWRQHGDVMSHLPIKTPLSGAVCSVETCSLPAKARGWCAGHWKRWRLDGDVDASRPLGVRKYMLQDPVCTVDICDRLIIANGLCRTHYSRLHQTGNLRPEVPIRRPSSRGRSLKDCRLWTRYKLTEASLADLLSAQGDACAICGSKDPKSGKGWNIDHDHNCCPGVTSCGQCVRGVLCAPCNMQLGKVEAFLRNPDPIKRYLGVA